MKKYISYLLTLALLVPAFVSCTQERDFLSKKQKTHTVFFATAETATRTGLTIEDNMVKPDWRGTDLENIHFFEIDATNAAAPGTADEIQLSDDNRTAHFKAAISDEIIINVPTSSDGKAASGAKSAGVSPFTFAAVVAQMPDKDAFTFVIPSEQHPDAETLKDPNAEFLVGYSRKSYAEQYDYDGVVVDLYFDRVAALGRLAISGFIGTGEKVKSVTITTKEGLTGKATYPGDFTLGDKNTVKFTNIVEPLTLAYGDGVAAPAEDPFYAYFVAVPGEATVTSIEVLTDQYKYTKTVAAGAKFTFTDEQLLNIDFALSADIAEAVTEDNNTWYMASVLEAGYDYIIVSGGKAMKNNGHEQKITAVDVEINDNTISPEDLTGLVWKAGNAPEALLENGRFTLTNNGTDHLWRHSNNGQFTIESNSEELTKYMVWEYDGQNFWNISNTQGIVPYYVYYSNNDWTSSSTATATTLFNNRPPQNISFAASGPFEYDIDDPTVDFEEPAISGNIGDVTYSSSDESLATVDPVSGNVTFLKAGVVEITAIAAGDDDHQAAKASYMIVITTDQIPTWYKADELVDGEVYMIVSNANAIRLDGSNLAAVSNAAFTGDSFQYEADDNLKWTAAASSGKFTFKSGSRFLSRSSGNIQTSSSSGAAWSYDSALNHITTTGNSGDYYLYYSGSAWAATTTVGSTTTAAVYTMTPQLASRNLKFSAESVTHDLVDGEDVNEPELTGDSLEGVTYASANEQIATVNANTGVVTLTGKTGSVKITASADKTDTYKAESVSYTLIVKNGAIGPKTYRKVTAASDLVAGARLILVYEAGPLVFMPILEESGTSFSKSDNSLSVDISSNTITSAELGDYELTLSEGYYLYVESANRYLYPYTADSGRTTALNAEVSPEHALTITISGGNTKIANEDNYLNYSTNNGGRFSSTTSSTLNVCVYKLDDGTTPPTPEKQERDLAYSATSFTCTLGQTATFPTLSGVTDGVNYTSSNESVATINTSGVVTVKAAGTTTIKAEALETDTYLAGSAQYTLTVTEASSTTKTYVKVDELYSGETYLIVSHTDALAFKGDGVTTDAEAGASMSVSPANGAISGPESNFTEYEAIIKEESSGHFSIFFKNLGKYVSLNNSGNNGLNYVDSWTSGSTADFSLSTVSSGTYEGSFLFTSGSRYLYHNDTQFKLGGSGSSKGVHLYLLNTGQTLAQNLKFSTTNVSVYENGSFTKPVLSGAKTPVDYRSDNTSVAEVNSTNGDVTIKGVGTAHITAEAGSGQVGALNFGPGSAQYTLTVNPAQSVATYYRTSSIEAGKQYLIVSNGYLLNNTGSAGGAEAVTVSGNEIQVAASETMLWTATASSGKFTLGNGGSYLYRSSTTFSISTSSVTWSCDSDGKLTTAGSSSTYYLYYSESQSKWSVSNSPSDSHSAWLYTTDPGTTPDPGDDPTPTTSTYTQVSFATGITTGKYLIVNPADTHVFNTSTNASNAVAVSVSGGVISGDYSSYELTITKSGDNYTIQNGSNEYLYYNYNQGDQRVGYQSGVNNWTVSAGSDASDTNAFRFTSSNQNIYWNSTYFRIGGSGTTGIHLYKKADNP